MDTLILPGIGDPFTTDAARDMPYDVLRALNWSARTDDRVTRKAQGYQFVGGHSDGAAAAANSGCENVFMLSPGWLRELSVKPKNVLLMATVGERFSYVDDWADYLEVEPIFLKPPKQPWYSKKRWFPHLNLLHYVYYIESWKQSLRESCAADSRQQEHSLIRSWRAGSRRRDGPTG